MSKKDLIQTAATLIVLIGAAIGVNSHFAKAADVELIAMRLEQKIVSDATMQTETRRWQILDRNNARDCQDIKIDRDREECRSLEQQIKDLDQKNKILIERTVPVKNK
jgi:hypothetical protein